MHTKLASLYSVFIKVDVYNKSSQQNLRPDDQIDGYSPSSHTDHDIWEVVTWRLFLLPLQSLTPPVNSSGYVGWPNHIHVSSHWCALLCTWRIFAVLNLFHTYSISGDLMHMYICRCVCTNMQHLRMGWPNTLSDMSNFVTEKQTKGVSFLRKIF